MNQRMKSRNLHSEIVFCLGTNNNIASTLNTFGISATTTELIVVKAVSPSLGLNAGLAKEEVEAALKGCIVGEMVEWGEVSLHKVCDVKKIEKLYKLGKSGDKGSKGRRRKDGSLEGERTEKDAGEELVLAAEERASFAGEQKDYNEQKELEMKILGLMALRGAG